MDRMGGTEFLLLSETGNWGHELGSQEHHEDRLPKVPCTVLLWWYSENGELDWLL
jgi:hypothetical protein